MADSRPILIDGERYSTRLSPASRGGGEKYHPRTMAQVREHLLPQAQQLARGVTTLPDSLRGPRVVFLATILPNYLANSYFPRQLLAHLGLVPLGSIQSTGVLRTERRTQAGVPTKTLILAGSDTSIARLPGLLQDVEADASPRQAQSDLRIVEELRLPVLADVVGSMVAADAPDGLYEAVLHPDSAGIGLVRAPLDDATFGKLSRLVSGLGGEVLSRYRRDVHGLTFVPLRLPTEAVAAVAAFNPLRSLRPLPALRPLPRSVLRAVGTMPPPKPSQRPKRPLATAIFDGGLDATTEYFGRWVDVRDLATRPASALEAAHGTAVTSAFLYGHVDALPSLPDPPSPVHHYRVMPTKDPRVDPDLYVLLDQIVSVLRDGNGGYDLVNLSIGPYASVEDDLAPNRWTATLDDLAYEKGLLFILAAGNNGKGDPGLGLNRVQIPGDMVNGLAVGACDVPEPETPWDRVAYSAVGPGRAGARVQPVGVAFGGSDTQPFNWVSAIGEVGDWQGTSFAAPLFAGGMAALAARLGPKSDADVLRAFAIHFAERVNPARYAELGHGRLMRDYESQLDCPPNAVTVLYRGVAERSRVDRLLLPVPDNLPPTSRVRLSWTLSYRSPTDPAEAAEYTKASLDVVFRPNQYIHTLTEAGHTTSVDVRTRTAQIQEVLARGGTLSEHPRSKSTPGGAEAGLRAEGKWETLSHQSVGMLASSLSRPVLDLSYLAREAGVLIDAAPPVGYALLATVEVRQHADLYDQVRTAYPLLSQLQVQARPRLQT